MTTFNLIDMAVRIRTRRLNFSGLSALQILLIIIAAALSIAITMFIKKKKPELSDMKLKLITFGIAIILFIPIIILL